MKSAAQLPIDPELAARKTIYERSVDMQGRASLDGYVDESEASAALFGSIGKNVLLTKLSGQPIRKTG